MLSDAQLTEEEKVRVRHHLDFLNVVEAYTLLFGMPAGVQPQFWIEGAMLRIKAEALGHVRMLLGRCDATEAQMFENTENQAVRKLGNIEINNDEFEQLRDGPLLYWQNKLAIALGVIKNPFSPQRNGGGLNVRVSG